MDTGSTRIDVVPGTDGAWYVREPGAARPMRQLRTEAEAVTQARMVLLRNRGGEVHVRALDGSNRRVHTVEVPARPWWYVRPTGFIAATVVLFNILGILALVNDRDSLPWWPGGLYLVLGTSYLVSFMLSRRHDRLLAELDPSSIG